MFSLPAFSQDLSLIINTGQPIVSQSPQPTIAGSTDAPEGSKVAVTVGDTTQETTVGDEGAWNLTWSTSLTEVSYTVLATVTAPDGRTASAEQLLFIELPGRLAGRPFFEIPEDYAAPEESRAEDFQEQTDRWRIKPPPNARLVEPKGKLDPYNQSKWKGDFPVSGDDVFLVLTGVSDTLAEGRALPTPSGVSTDRQGSIEFFGRDGQFFGLQTVSVSADLFKGRTAYKPIEWRLKGTLTANLSFLAVAENAVVKPDVRDGTTRTRGDLSFQELFAEKKLRDLSPNYDFVSVRVGIQPFSSDFRGFVFTDTNLGVRLFGNLNSNRDQYNLAYFERLEKDTNSGLNTFEWRDQRVAVANVYRQDFLTKGYTAQASIHYLLDEPSFKFDKNGFLARPDPVGSFTPHEIEALYLGIAGFGHVGRINVDHALYFVTGEDSLNPIAGPARLGKDESDSVDIRAGMAALEVSIDRDWLRPRLAFFYATGDDDPVDRDAEGFDSIFDNPAFAGGGFSFWNRMGIRLAGTGVTLVNRGSLLPDLRSSKEEGQPNFVNPGLRLASVGLDAELTPKLKAVATANYLQFDTTETLKLLLFQGAIDEEIGWDVSVGARFRPYLNQNVVIVGGLAGFFPGQGFEDIYEDGSPLYAAFANVILTY